MYLILDNLLFLDNLIFQLTVLLKLGLWFTKLKLFLELQLKQLLYFSETMRMSFLSNAYKSESEIFLCSVGTKETGKHGFLKQYKLDLFTFSFF